VLSEDLGPLLSTEPLVFVVSGLNCAGEVVVGPSDDYDGTSVLSEETLVLHTHERGESVYVENIILDYTI
jgi:hypothetical protein